MSKIQLDTSKLLGAKLMFGPRDCNGPAGVSGAKLGLKTGVKAGMKVGVKVGVKRVR